MVLLVGSAAERAWDDVARRNGVAGRNVARHVLMPDLAAADRLDRARADRAGAGGDGQAWPGEIGQRE